MCIKLKPVIAIDFDDTIAQTLKEIYRIADVHFDINEITDYTTAPTKFGKEKFYELLLQAHQSSYLIAYPFAITTIQKLMLQYKIIIVTSNKLHHIQYIQHWLHRAGIYLEVFPVDSFDEKFKLKWDLLIDDHPSLKSNGLIYNRMVIQYPQPYNGEDTYTWKIIPTLVSSKLLVHV